jgi:hypothetical protein
MGWVLLAFTLLNETVAFRIPTDVDLFAGTPLDADRRRSGTSGRYGNTDSLFGYEIHCREPRA